LYINETSSGFRIIDNLFEDILMNQSRYNSYTKIENDDFDQLYINEADDGFYIIASRGRGIISLHYSGDVKFDKGLEEVLEHLKHLE